MRSLYCRTRASGRAPWKFTPNEAGTRRRYCPQDAVFRVKKDKGTTGRYVDTDYMKCIGCHICADVCPSGYIDMGMGE